MRACLAGLMLSGCTLATGNLRLLDSSLDPVVERAKAWGYAVAPMPHDGPAYPGWALTLQPATETRLWLYDAPDGTVGVEWSTDPERFAPELLEDQLTWIREVARALTAKEPSAAPVVVVAEARDMDAWRDARAGTVFSPQVSIGLSAIAGVSLGYRWRTLSVVLTPQFHFAAASPTAPRQALAVELGLHLHVARSFTMRLGAIVGASLPEGLVTAGLELTPEFNFGEAGRHRLGLALPWLVWQHPSSAPQLGSGLGFFYAVDLR
jgi:hypothetical protein